MANQWVLTGQCPHLPLMHHWRILPLVSRGADDRRNTEVWGYEPAIQRRVSAIEEATHSAALFMEYFPRTVGDWLRERLADELDGAAAVQEVETALLDTLVFTHDQELLHMDVHLENILTDGERLYLGDFGLSISRSFHLDPEELVFFEQHENYDRCTAITSHVHAIVAHYDARADWRTALRELAEGTHSATKDVPDTVRSYLVKRCPLAMAMGNFYDRLKADLATEYPASDLQELLDGV